MGALFTFLSTGEDTNGEFLLVEAVGQSGGEPPQHTHAKEDEAYYVLEGAMEFWVGDSHLEAPVGSYVFLPRDVMHCWKITSGTARFLFMCWPAGLEGYFNEFAEPAERLEIPRLPDFSKIDMPRFLERGRAYGIEFQLTRP
jgi:quercetin dioxygenase-like cupin family protein